MVILSIRLLWIDGRFPSSSPNDIKKWSTREYVLTAREVYVDFAGFEKPKLKSRATERIYFYITLQYWPKYIYI